MIGQEAERLENTSVQCAREPKCREWADQEKFQAARKRKIELTPSARWQTSTGKTNDRTSWVHTPDETTAQRELKFEVENSKYRSERNRERLAYRSERSMSSVWKSIRICRDRKNHTGKYTPHFLCYLFTASSSNRGAYNRRRATVWDTVKKRSRR